MSLLSKRTCTPCEKGTPPLPASAVKLLLDDLSGWALVDGKMIRKLITCKDFMDAVRFIQRIAEIAEAENHHPDLHLTSYKKLTIELSTHAIGGLSENDFIVAAKIDELLSERR